MDQGRGKGPPHFGVAHIAQATGPAGPTLGGGSPGPSDGGGDVRTGPAGVAGLASALGAGIGGLADLQDPGGEEEPGGKRAKVMAMKAPKALVLIWRRR